MKRFASEHPLAFVLITILAWILVAFGVVVLCVVLLGLSPGDDLVQSLATLTATACLLLLGAYLGWLREAGITRLGSVQIWLLAIAILAYLYVAYRYAFFGKVAPDRRLLVWLPAAWRTITRQLIVGFVEETLFRGILLYALVRAWGGTRRRLLAAVAVPAALFGALHIMQLTTGNSLPSTLVVIVDCLFSGIWLGALVLRGGSIWPGVLIHAGSNAVVNVGALAVPGFAPPTSAFVLATALEVPLVLWGLWVLGRLPLRQRDEDVAVEADRRVADPAGA